MQLQIKIWFKKVIILFVAFYSTNDFAFAQEAPADTDSTHLYEDIESYSERSKFTRFIYKLLFKPVTPDPAKRKVNKKLITKPYSSFEGKIIRHINIETLDPFGYSVNDTITGTQSFLSRAGNRMHIRTHPATIRNLLLIRQNQTVDPLLVKESERLVRSMGYISDVSFYMKVAPESSDSVDIIIRGLDKWSIVPDGSFSSSRFVIRIKDDNFLGLGHEFQNRIVWNHSTGDNAYRTKYFIPNFRNTFINSTIQYGRDEFGNFIKNIAVDRPFVSPFTRWAAGVNFSQHFHNDSIPLSNFIKYKYNAQDYWAGNAFRIFKGNAEYIRTTNFISTARFTRIRYLEKPPETLDTLKYFTDENLYLASLGISTRQYIQDQFIFRFGITEDVPVGTVISLTGGYQEKNNTGRVYLGARFSSGNYHSWGYLSSNIEIGTFFNASQTDQGVFRVGASYFTGLIEIGKWKFRQFIKPQFIIGFNRSDFDSLTINDAYGLPGFRSPLLSGNSRLLFTSQTQSYAPLNFIGFHFGPYFTFSLGMLGDEKNGFRDSKMYSQIGLGVLIKNEKLVLSSFQISIAFYPVIPGKGENIFRINSFQSVDFGFNDFEIGKPETVVFR